MRKIILPLILSFFGFKFLTAQHTISETEKLASFGKMYGFLKYYHPEVSKGKYNWDSEFIKYLPQILKATDKASLSLIYNNWIDSLGKIEVCEKCDSEEHYFDKNLDLSWTQDSMLFDNELMSKLKFIERNRYQEESFYVTTEAVGKIKIINEPVYRDFEYPDQEYRLLGLFKYWNVIEYFYPYKYLTDQNWDSVLIEMIPRFRNASDKKEYRSAIKELIAKLDDTHAWVSFNDERSKYLPVKVSNIENRVVISGFYNDSLAGLSNLKLGDMILKINDMDLRKETEENLKYVSGSNLNIKTRKTYDRVLSGEDSIVTLSIERDGRIEEISAKRYSFSDFNYWANQKRVKSKLIKDDMGYINLANDINKREADDIFKSFEDKKAIIIDLRSYPNSRYGIFSKHLNSGKRTFARIYSPNLKYPGTFLFKKDKECGIKNKKAFKGKVVLLVNEDSISRAEFVAMAFQTGDNVITVGNQTAAADGDVVIFEFIGGYKTAISGNGILYPDGSQTQRKGVKIDVEVKPTINGLRQGRDEVLEKAIELLSK